MFRLPGDKRTRGGGAEGGREEEDAPTIPLFVTTLMRVVPRKFLPRPLFTFVFRERFGRRCNGSRAPAALSGIDDGWLRRRGVRRRRGARGVFGARGGAGGGGGEGGFGLVRCLVHLETIYFIYLQQDHVFPVFPGSFRLVPVLVRGVVLPCCTYFFSTEAASIVANV